MSTVLTHPPDNPEISDAILDAPVIPDAAPAPEGQTGEQGFGPHLMLDCRGCDPDKIGDVSYIFKTLCDITDAIGMTRITQPYVFPYEGLVPEDRGVTGIVVIAESHLSFHSFVDKDYFFFDLFSCREFDVDRVRQMVIEAFGVKNAEHFRVDRGRYFPRSPLPAHSSAHA